MRKLFYSIWKYVLDLIIFSGFPIVGYFASENGKKLLGENNYSIIKDYELLLYLLISIIYLIYKVLLTKSSFTNQSDIDEIRTTVTLSLSQIVEKYIHYIKIHRGDDAEIPSFRMNIMLLTQGGFLRKNYMKMYFYSSFPDDLLYSEKELQMKWYKGKGACGISWKTGRHVVYDSADPNLKDPINSLTKKQKELFNGNQSILSIPIWSKFRENKRVFAILNLDSNHKADLTLIKNAGIIRGLSNEIVLLSYVLSDFHNGVLDDE